MKCYNCSEEVHIHPKSKKTREAIKLVNAVISLHRAMRAVFVLSKVEKPEKSQKEMEGHVIYVDRQTF